MCGIVGGFGHDIAEDALSSAVNALHHRGPDGRGIFFDGERRLAMGHARLSVIDLETGAQPLYAADGALVPVCNGEIYDFRRIRSELLGRGYSFQTKSDSEVILHLYREHGLAFTNHLRGEFAFLLLDKARQKLLAVRDRFGIKPLYFNRQNGKYIFASEAKAIFATGRLRPRLNVVAIRDYLSSIIPNSIFEGVETVPAGCVLEVDLRSGRHEVRRYWDLDLPAGDENGSNEELEPHLRAVRTAVEEAVRLRLQADVPVGVYLSGGLDSAIVAATAAKQLSHRLKAFTIAFPDNDAYDESSIARSMAEKIGAELHTVACDQDTLIQNLEDSLWATELPALNLHGVAKFLLSRLAQQHVKVVLTGEGADEIFLGYRKYRRRHAPWNKRLPGRIGHPDGKLEQQIRSAMPAYNRLFARLPQYSTRRMFHPRHRKMLKESHPFDTLSGRIDPAQFEGLSIQSQIQYISIKSNLTPYILNVLGDRAEMSHAIEGRTPFLDHRLFECARMIPDQMKIRGETDKFVLREAFKNDITEEIYRREKSDFKAPPLSTKWGGLTQLTV
jgi:asparagine synthase (glutamine-hydrolysing)